jgi:hypothetical protein
MDSMNCLSEIDESQLVDAEGVAHYRMMTGSANWAIALGQHDIQHAVSVLLSSAPSHLHTTCSVRMALSSLPALQQMLEDDDFKQLSIEAGPLTGIAWVQTQRKAMRDLFITDENSNDSNNSNSEGSEFTGNSSISTLMADDVKMLIDTQLKAFIMSKVHSSGETSTTTSTNLKTHQGRGAEDFAWRIKEKLFLKSL